jgi:hypothetical protein
MGSSQSQLGPGIDLAVGAVGYCVSAFDALHRREICHVWRGGGGVVAMRLPTLGTARELRIMVDTVFLAWAYCPTEKSRAEAAALPT